jgi:hypothetical protein
MTLWPARISTYSKDRCIYFIGKTIPRKLGCPIKEKKKKKKENPNTIENDFPQISMTITNKLLYPVQGALQSYKSNIHRMLLGISTHFCC